MRNPKLNLEPESSVSRSRESEDIREFAPQQQPQPTAAIPSEASRTLRLAATRGEEVDVNIPEEIVEGTVVCNRNGSFFRINGYYCNVSV